MVRLWFGVRSSKGRVGSGERLLSCLERSKFREPQCHVAFFSDPDCHNHMGGLKARILIAKLKASGTPGEARMLEI